MFGLEATTQDFSKKLLKWQADVRGDSTKCATFETQAVEAANVRIFFGTVKGDAELKICHSMLKYKNCFVAQNISVNVILFMGDCPLEGRPWVSKIPQDKPWAWPEIKLPRNAIEMQTHFSQEGNRHFMWDTTVKTNLTKKCFQGWQ